MNKLPKILATGAIISLSSTFFATTAMADASGNAPLDAQRKTSVVPEEVVDVQQEPGQVILVGSKGEEVIHVDDGRTVAEVLEDADKEVAKYESSDDSDVSPETAVDSGDVVTLYQSETSGTSETVVIEKTTVEEETDDLLVGETEVSHEGKDGEALKTTVTKKSGESGKETTEENYIVIEQPEPEVILVGTAEPEPEPEPTPEPTETESADSGSTTTATPASGSSSSSSSSDSSNSSSTSSNSSSSNSSNSNSSSSTKEAGNHKVAEFAREQLGKPYVWGASGPSSFDCSGLVQYVMNKAGKSVPRTSGAQWAASTPVAPKDIQVGDILWRPGHIGIYVGDGRVVHSSSPGVGTIEISLQSWLDRGMKVGRL